jgi:hypothetical protein
MLHSQQIPKVVLYNDKGDKLEEGVPIEHLVVGDVYRVD